MGTSMVERDCDDTAGTPRGDRPRWRVLSPGALAGLVVGLFLTLLQALARLWAGVAPPSELIGDRIAPLLPVPAGATGYHRVLAKVEA